MDTGQVLSSLAGTFLGVLLGSFFTYRLGLLISRKQQKTTNNLVRKEQVYEPMFEDLKYIRDYLSERMDASREYTRSEDPPLSFYTWNQIKADRRILLVNNKQIEDSCNRVVEQINHYHRFIGNTGESLQNGIRDYFTERFQCEPSRTFDGSLFILALVDRRFPLQRAFDDLLSPGSFPVPGQWQKLQEELDTLGLEEVQQELLEHLAYEEKIAGYDSCARKILHAVDATRNLLVKEIRRIIKESEN